MNKLFVRRGRELDKDAVELITWVEYLEHYELTSEQFEKVSVDAIAN